MSHSCATYFQRQELCHPPSASCTWPVTHHHADNVAFPTAVLCATLERGAVSSCMGISADVDCYGKPKNALAPGAPSFERIKVALQWFGMVAERLAASGSGGRRHVAFSPVDLLLLEDRGRQLARRLSTRGTPLFAGATTRADHEAGVQFMADITFAEAHGLKTDFHHSVASGLAALPLPTIRKAVWRGAPSSSASEPRRVRFGPPDAPSWALQRVQLCFLSKVRTGPLVVVVSSSSSSADARTHAAPSHARPPPTPCN